MAKFSDGSSNQRKKTRNSRAIPAPRRMHPVNIFAAPSHARRRLPRNAPVGAALQPRLPFPKKSLRQRRRARMIVRLFVILIFLASVVGGFSYLSHRDNLQIQNVRVEGAHTLSAVALQAAVERELAGNWAVIFSRKSAFLYPKDDITVALREHFPALASVQIGIVGLAEEGGAQLAVEVTEREPYALWCPADGTCYALDNSGYVFASARQAGIARGEKLVFVGGIASSSDPLGHNLLPDTFADVLQTIEALSAVVPNPIVARIEPTTEEEMAETISLEYESGTEVRFYALQAKNAKLLAENLHAALESEALKARALHEIEYIDLRFENRLYYRLRGKLDLS